MVRSTCSHAEPRIDEKQGNKKALRKQVIKYAEENQLMERLASGWEVAAHTISCTEASFLLT